MTSLGIVGIPSDSPDELFLITSLFCMTGVPIADIALGNYATKLIENQESEKIKCIIHNKYDEHELKLFEQLGLDEGNNSFDKNEFVIFSLVRANLVSIDFLKEIFEKFEKLDYLKEKKIKFSDLISRQEKLSSDENS